MNIIGNKGFTNIGNTCYMNSILQCLCHLPQLQSNHLKKEYKKNVLSDKSIINEWIRIQNNMWDNDDSIKYIHTMDILKCFIHKCQEKDIYFESFNQNDSSEFLIYFLDFFHDCIKRKVSVTITGEVNSFYDKLKIKSIESWKTFFQNNYSYIIQNFYSESLSFISCSNCNHININHEPMLVITLTQKKEFTSIHDCLQEYIKKDTLDIDNSWKCDKCNENNCPDKKILFWEFSPIVIFQIKQYNDNSHKLNNHIDFPLSIDLNDYCINSNNHNTIYKLISTSIHSGSLRGGHYYANCLNINDNQWYNYNDTNVSLINEKDVLQENPYCFFYIREE